MQHPAGEDAGREMSMRKVAFASFIGTAIEFYDFYIYGTAAAPALGGAFFPDFDETAGTLAAFATFAVGFAARPLGGIVYGRFGDRIGRKAMLIVSLLVVGVATFCIGLFPGYATICVAAPLLRHALRPDGGVPPGALRDAPALLGGIRELQPRGRPRRRRRPARRDPTPRLDGGVVVHLPLRAGDVRRKLRVRVLALGDIPDLSGIRSEERRLLAEKGTPAPEAGSSPQRRGAARQAAMPRATRWSFNFFVARRRRLFTVPSDRPRSAEISACVCPEK